MVFVWNRKEIYMGYSMERFREIRDLLEDEKIKYDYKTVNRNEPSILGSGRGRSGSFGVPTETTYMYSIYVHKKDYEQASYVISEKRH